MLSILDIAIGMFDCDFLKGNPSKWTSGWFPVADTPFQFGFLELLSANHQFFGNCLNSLTMEMALFWSAFGVLCYIESPEKFTFLFEVFKTQIIHVIPDKIDLRCHLIKQRRMFAFYAKFKCFHTLYFNIDIFIILDIFQFKRRFMSYGWGKSLIFWPGKTWFYTQLNKLLAIISVLV